MIADERPMLIVNDFHLHSWALPFLRSALVLLPSLDGGGLSTGHDLWPEPAPSWLPVARYDLAPTKTSPPSVPAFETCDAASKVVDSLAILLVYFASYQCHEVVSLETWWHSGDPYGIWGHGTTCAVSRFRSSVPSVPTLRPQVWLLGLAVHVGR